MSQTSIIAGALIIAYIVFVTVRGELPAFLDVLGIGSNCGSSPCCNLTAGGGSGGSVQCAWYDIPCQIAKVVTNQPA